MSAALVALVRSARAAGCRAPCLAAREPTPSLLLSPSLCSGEGLLGTCLMAGLVLPLVQLLPEGGGLHEDSWDTLAMLRSSGPLQAAAAASLVCLAAYNLAGAPRCAAAMLRWGGPHRRTAAALPLPTSLLCAALHRHGLYGEPGRHDAYSARNDTDAVCVAAQVCLRCMLGCEQQQRPLGLSIPPATAAAPLPLPLPRSLLLFYADPLPGTCLGEPWTRASWVQAAGFAVLVSGAPGWLLGCRCPPASTPAAYHPLPPVACRHHSLAGTLVYGHGEERSIARLKARLRWARLRASLTAVMPLLDAARPLQAPRIAGPARLRTAFLQRAAVAALVERLEESRAEESRASSSGHGSSVHASVLAAAATAAAAQLEDGDEEGGSPSSPTADWVARSQPRVAPPFSGTRFVFAAPPGMSRSAPC